MDFIIVSVLREGDNKIKDIEVPAYLPVKEWLEGLLYALDLQKEQQLYEKNEQITLKAYDASMQGICEVVMNKSLAELGIKNGDWIILNVASSVASQSKVSQGPVKGWRKLSGAKEKVSQSKGDYPEWMKKPLDE